jgi:hypothetical protein
MIALMQRAGDRLLAKLVPEVSAGAWCYPQSYCELCPNSGYRKRRVTIMYDCKVTYGYCTLNC